MYKVYYRSPLTFYRYVSDLILSRQISTVKGISYNHLWLKTLLVKKKWLPFEVRGLQAVCVCNYSMFKHKKFLLQNLSPGGLSSWREYFHQAANGRGNFWGRRLAMHIMWSVSKHKQRNMYYGWAATITAIKKTELKVENNLSREA